MRSDQLIILFIKAPLPGDVKSRLAAGIGEEAALGLYRMLVLDAVEMLGETNSPVHYYYSPAHAGEAISSLVGADRVLRPQAGADLGSRMEHAFRDAFAEGFSRVVLVGSDLPELEPMIISEAFDALKQEDAVLGPAADGGYYLIGFRRETILSGVFHGIAWSTPTVFEETMKTMHANALRVHVLPQLHDLDTAADLKALWERNRNGIRKSRAWEYIERHQKTLFAFHRNLE
jgi:rSAM/selenodomain-associated transferase 1